MTPDQIRDNIRYNENLIDQFYSEKTSIEEKIEELEQLRGKFSTLQNSFRSKQDNRQQGLSRFSQVSLNNKIFTSYLSGMTDLLNGAQFKNAFDGLTTAKRKISSKIQELLQEFMILKV